MGSTNGWSGLPPGLELHTGEELRSHSGAFKLRLQGDGNLVALNQDDQPYWTSITNGHPDLRLVMQTDGNLVLVDSHGIPWWSTWTDHNKNDAYTLPQPAGTFLIVQDDGNVVLVSPSGQALWTLWQNQEDRGTNALAWIESTVGNIATFARDAIKVMRVVLPAVGAVIAATGVGAPLGAALAAYGAELEALDATIDEIGGLIQQGKDGYHAAVAVLNDLGVTADQIDAVRNSLSPADQVGFDYGVQHADSIAAGPVPAATAKLHLATGGKLTQIAQAIGTQKTSLPSGSISRIAAAVSQVLDDSVAQSNAANQIAILAKASGLTPEQYARQVRATAAPVVSPPPPTPSPTRAPAPVPPSPPASSSGSSGSSAAILVGVGILGALMLSR